jgi:hypothetical protein
MPTLDTGILLTMAVSSTAMMRMRDLSGSLLQQFSAAFAVVLLSGGDT